LMHFEESTVNEKLQCRKKSFVSVLIFGKYLSNDPSEILVFMCCYKCITMLSLALLSK
jgi:hypothetical protein